MSAQELSLFLPAFSLPMVSLSLPLAFSSSCFGIFVFLNCSSSFLSLLSSFISLSFLPPFQKTSVLWLSLFYAQVHNTTSRTTILSLKPSSAAPLHPPITQRSSTQSVSLSLVFIFFWSNIPHVSSSIAKKNVSGWKLTFLRCFQKFFQWVRVSYAFPTVSETFRVSVRGTTTF